MLFLIIEKAIGQIPKEALEASGRCADYFAALKEKGKLKGNYHFAGIAGGAYILDVESNDELGETIIKSPFYKYTSRDIFPLMDERRLIEAEKIAAMN
ncbi:muconolactone Delta-isomerase family protein [Geotalea uraniireducens]|nr:muconolactone Delta-isomerase family protein [Geotalea uraniireducens]